MKLRVFVVTALLLYPASYALADEGHDDIKEITEDIEMFKDGEVSGDGTHNEHNMTSDEHSDMNGTESSEHNDATSEGGHGHGTEVIVETPPNYTVLSIFGAINLSFLAFGLWNKRIRKRVV
ncbi:hypothetical protein EKG37_17730 [Robertmurraya yapensis]|uniref:LPXTG cell wall anchor domain-containing protein n=1 Tax=Bacillus yapensis TaxID=2492960 RepID=A0A431VXX7_9BACI|nr:hypothetical protein [Bacillus yapensis]RTR28142.1 hypothetical protein EKG37_17730 [Bacillus yapensis]TKS94385.1 hypothetical protein FAR12_17735 [Bacillus yapensis]